MKIKSFITILLWLVSGVFISIQAQSVSMNKESRGVKLMGITKDNAIHLRWAPTDPTIWAIGNINGYKIVRYTVKTDGQISKDKEMTMLTPEPITYRPVDDWEAIIQEPYAPVAAQALFGETFEVSRKGNPSLIEAVNKSREQESRFSLSLMAADLSPVTADYSGLYYVDETAAANKKYLYKVYIPEAKMALDTGMVYLGLDEKRALPNIKSLSAQSFNKTVQLKWNTTYGFNYYTAYNIERSTDSINFKQVNDLPLVNADYDPNKIENFLYATDSLEVNNIQYFYRVRGITPFGELGPTSNIVRGKGKLSLPVKPFNVQHTYDEAGMIVLNWEFDEAFEYMIDGFHIVRVENLDEGRVVKINQELIKPEVRSFVDKQPLTSNYYKVIAQSQYGDMQASVTHMAQTVDSIPPLPTKIYEVKVDTAGIARINWLANKEKDLYGYKVMKAYDQQAEFSLINSKILKDTLFVDTLNINRLTKKVFYKVISLDKHYNHSNASPTFEASFPDIVPPTSPVLFSVSQDSLGLKLEWRNSTSKDVRANLIYRKSNNSGNWILINAIGGQDTTWHDQDVVSGTNYVYTMIAADSAGNESKPERAIPIKYIDKSLKEGIQFFDLSADRKEKHIKIEWQLPEAGIQAIELYKGDENNSIKFYKKLNYPETSFVDDALIVNTVYEYSLRVVFTDGSRSKFSQIKKIKY